MFAKKAVPLRLKNIMTMPFAKHILVLTVCWLVALPSLGRVADPVLDSLLRRIDDAVARSDEFVAQKEARIAVLKEQLSKASDAAAQLSLSQSLADEYEPYVNDSCIYYLTRCAQLAEASGMTSRSGGCLSRVALMYSQAGMFVEAFSTLADIDSTRLAGTDLGLYYFAYAHIYGENSFYTCFQTLHDHYGVMAHNYRQRMFRLLPPGSKYVRQYREIELMNDKRYGDSKRLNDEWIKQTDKSSAEYALVAFYRYLEYKAIGDSVQKMRWLAEAVLADACRAVMDQGAMWEMANELYSIGDVDRAYNYITYANSCANKFGSRQRLARISPLMNEIARLYKAENEKNNQHVRLALIALSAMTVLLLITLFYVNKQRSRLAVARDDLAKSNSQLSQLNQAQSSLNRQLQASNAHLSEANRVKDEYVGRFLRQCSLYIDKLDNLRKTVNKKVKNHQYDELLEMTKSQKFRSEELNELYVNFDKAFLHLFPTFVDDFNALLRPEERIPLADDGCLTTTHRIFALIRLGVTDSSKIAEFLHYSANTIYNYRAHTKNGALGDRQTFEDRVSKIGQQQL